LQQLILLYNHLQEYEISKLRFSAGIHGIDLDKLDGKNAGFDVGKKIDQENWIFKPRSAYAHMTPEEKQAETERMMSFLKPWAAGAMGASKKKRK